MRCASVLFGCALLAFNTGCASVGDLDHVRYVPHAGFPAADATKAVKQRFLEGAQALESSTELGQIVIGERIFSKDALLLYYNELGFKHASQIAAREKDWLHSNSGGWLGELMKEDWEQESAMWNYNVELKERLARTGDGHESAPSPLDIMQALEPHPYFEEGLEAGSHLPKQAIFDYYRIWTQPQADGRLHRVGWRELDEGQLGEYFKGSGADQAYQLWSQGQATPNYGARVLAGAAATGGLAGLVGSYLIYRQNSPSCSQDCGLNVLIVPLYLGLGAAAGSIAAMIVALPAETRCGTAAGPGKTAKRSSYSISI